MALAIQLSTQTGLAQQDTPSWARRARPQPQTPLGCEPDVLPAQEGTPRPAPRKRSQLLETQVFGPPPFLGDAQGSSLCSEPLPRPSWVFSRWSPYRNPNDPPDPPRGFI